MHKSSYQKMEKFVSNYVAGNYNPVSKVIDFGESVCQRELQKTFDLNIWNYVGVDQSFGKNVDLVFLTRTSGMKLNLNPQIS